MTNATESTLSAIFFSIILIAYFYPTKTDVKIHLALCAESDTSGTCTKEISSNTITTKASFETQTVVIGYETTTPSKLKDCAVFDYKNWECKNDVGLPISMIDGNISRYSVTHQIGMVKWWWLRTNEFFTLKATK